MASRREVQKSTRRWHDAVATGAFVAAIALAALGVVDFLKALLVLLALYLLAGLARPEDLRRNMPCEIIVVTASSLVISEVMLSTGTANLLAAALLLGAEPWGPYAALALILVVAWVL